MQALERSGRLNRAVEFLPDDAALSERALRGEALTRPELAVLLAYAKLDLHDQLLDSPVSDEPFFARELEGYFPAAMRARFPTLSRRTGCGATSSRRNLPTASSAAAGRRS